jgi:hypothetical protein
MAVSSNAGLSADLAAQQSDEGKAGVKEASNLQKLRRGTATDLQTVAGDGFARFWRGKMAWLSRLSMIDQWGVERGRR